MEHDERAVICEAPIDALSYAALRHDPTERTRYFATGGRISRFQWELIDGLMQKYRSKKIAVILAFDNDPGGKGYILQFHERYPGMKITIDLPPQQGQDWNDVLQSKLSISLTTGRDPKSDNVNFHGGRLYQADNRRAFDLRLTFFKKNCPYGRSS